MEQNSTSQNRVESRFKPMMVIWPILFGLIGVGYMLWREMHTGIPQEPLTLVKNSWFFMLLVVLLTFLKDCSDTKKLAECKGGTGHNTQTIHTRTIL